MTDFRRAAVSILAVLASAACSASSGPAGTAVGESGGGGSGGNGGIPTSGTGQGGSGLVITGGTDSGGTAGVAGDTCAVASTMGRLVKEPVNIVIILDNSGSMHEEMGAAETNLNTVFPQILDTNSVNYRVILLSRHRDGPRTTGETEENTSICVAQPLSGLATCPGPDPVFSDRFFQYNLKVESDDSWDKTLAWYNMPDDNGDDALAPNGWGAWLRAGAKKVFIEMTDDTEDMTSAAFTEALSALSPENFGTPEEPTFTFHSIIGIKEKANPTEAYLPSEPFEPAVCTGNGADIVNSGTVYQELSIATGGLRFPLCQFPGYDAVFQRIAENVVVTSEIACDFEIPPPPAGSTLDLGRVAVSYNPEGGPNTDAIEFGQAMTSADCQENAFYIENDRIYLCEEACAALQEDPFAMVDVLFKCESTIIPPR